MNIPDAYQFYCNHTSQSICSLTEDFIGTFAFDTNRFNHFRLLIFIRNDNPLKNLYDIDIWNSFLFFSLPKLPSLHVNTTILSFGEDCM